MNNVLYFSHYLFGHNYFWKWMYGELLLWERIMYCHLNIYSNQKQNKNKFVSCLVPWGRDRMRRVSFFYFSPSLYFLSWIKPDMRNSINKQLSARRIYVPCDSKRVKLEDNETSLLSSLNTTIESLYKQLFKTVMYIGPNSFNFTKH